jgi:hypothetical protein
MKLIIYSYLKKTKNELDNCKKYINKYYMSKLFCRKNNIGEKNEYDIAGDNKTAEILINSQNLNQLKFLMNFKFK